MECNFVAVCGELKGSRMVIPFFFSLKRTPSFDAEVSTLLWVQEFHGLECTPYAPLHSHYAPQLDLRACCKIDRRWHH
ncbi:hypothetical protein GOBAR_DD31036 [Gossypium barbadense]|nr:hypothetical protein GOBAR_DD31036 [Gossypium barbadense]